MSKEAKRKVLGTSRGVWTCRSATQVIKSKKGYDRKRDKKRVEKNWKEAY